VLNPLTAFALVCDLAGTIILIVDTVRDKKEAREIGAIERHVTGLEEGILGFEDLPPSPPGAEPVAGIDGDEIRLIMISASKQAAVNTKKLINEIRQKKDKRLQLSYFGLGLLLLGILLHSAEAIQNSHKEKQRDVNSIQTSIQQLEDLRSPLVRNISLEKHSSGIALPSLVAVTATPLVR
jgi:hypothetical protein